MPPKTTEPEVSLKEHVIVLIAALKEQMEAYKETSQTALKIASDVLAEHLRSLNGNQEQIKALQIDKAELKGKVSQNAFILSLFITVLGLFLTMCSISLAIFSIALRFMGV